MTSYENLQSELQMKKTILNAEDIADFLQVGIKTVYELLKNGKLKDCKVGREYKIAKCHLIEFIEENFTRETANDL